MKKGRLLPYRQSFPALLLFRMVALVVLQLWLFGLSKLSGLILKGTGRVAVTSGDIKFLFTSWQGILLIVLAILTLYLFIAVDINATIILSGRLLKGEKPRVFWCIKEGFLSIKKLFGPRGILIVLYLSLLSPVIGFGVSISLTSGFYIPKFITSVIYKNPFYLIGSIVVILALLVIGVLYSFILHGTLLDKKTLKQSGKDSLALIRKNWKNYLFEMIRFVILYLLIAIAILLILGVLPIFILRLVNLSEFVEIALTVFFMLMGLSLSVAFFSLSSSYSLLKLTGLYYKYQSEGEWTYRPRPKRVSPLVIVTLAVWLSLLIGFSFVSSAFRDSLFTDMTDTYYIAHRAGGDEAPENTVAGIEKAYQLGAAGSEIDIQRTSDGYYVVNHDATFQRVAGVDKTPAEMTLEEVKQLRVDGEPVPTLEDMLEASRDKVTLFVELKGETADEQMADDAVRIIKEMGMENQAVLISLKYDLISYIEEKYPEMETGYLAFASFGDTASLSCDYIALEEESVNETLTAEIHENGKKLLVWTVNETEDLYHFLNCNADGVITDSVAQSQTVLDNLKQRTVADRMYEYVREMFMYN